MELDEIITPSLDVPALNSEFIPVKHEVQERARITAPRRSRSRSPINIRRPGDWDCKEGNCKGMNYASRLYCFRCKAPKDDTLPKFEKSKASKDWICGNCSENNFGTRKICFKCSAPPSAFNPSNNAKTGQDWECLECDGNNFSRRIDCFRCHAPKPAPQPVRPSYDSKYAGDWICPECSGNNYSKRVDCYRCSAPKPQDDWGRRSNPYRPQFGNSAPAAHTQSNGEAQVFQSKYVDDWICPNTQCGGNNFSKRVDCYKCKTVKPGPRIRMNQTEYSVVDSYKEPPSRDARSRVGRPSYNPRPAYLDNPRPAYLENPRPARQAYYEPQPAYYERERPQRPARPAMKAQGAQRPGDWECPGCGSNNFSRRLDCFKCQKIKPGGASDNKYKDDWICESCQGNNYSRRTDCYKCKEPKPV